MNGFIKGLLVVGGLALIVIGLVVSSYNGLVSMQELTKNKWADVQTQYQRRVDLVDNLVQTTLGATQFEKETLQQIVDARTAWSKVSAEPNINAQVKAAKTADALLTPALGRLIAVAENYPQLQAVQAYRDLMVQLEGTENRVATARRDFNEAVRLYNLKVRSVPSNIIAGMFRFELLESFAAEVGADKAPKVDFTK